MLVEFDPTVTSYEAIIEAMYDQHNPFRPTKRQYRSAIWPQNEEQRKTAERVKAAREQEGQRTLFTDIEQPMEWYDAEEYHQKYVQKARRGW